MKTISLLISLLLLSLPCIAKEELNITFLNPGVSSPDDPTGQFWLSVSAFMRAAADDLDINLKIIYSERDHFLMQKQATEVMSRPSTPDYLIVVNEKRAATDIVKTAEEKGVNVFLMLNGFANDQAVEFGKPRENYSHWLGQLLPDNKQAGYQQAKRLINARRQYDSNVNIVAIGGDKVTPAAVERLKGLKRAVKESPNVILKQVFHAYWREDTAQEKMNVALKRYPATDVIWAANDPSAIGAIKAIRAADKVPGKDILVGGLNWDKAIFSELASNSVLVSLGGHFMTGAWALVLLHDYHKGIDFAQQAGRFAHRTEFSALTAENAPHYQSIFAAQDWGKINFQTFSKHYNKKVKDYDFSLEAIYRQFPAAPHMKSRQCPPS